MTERQRLLYVGSLEAEVRQLRREAALKDAVIADLRQQLAESRAEAALWVLRWVEGGERQCLQRS